MTNKETYLSRLQGNIAEACAYGSRRTVSHRDALAGVAFSLIKAVITSPAPCSYEEFLEEALSVYKGGIMSCLDEEARRLELDPDLEDELVEIIQEAIPEALAGGTDAAGE